MSVRVVVESKEIGEGDGLEKVRMFFNSVLNRILNVCCVMSW